MALFEFNDGALQTASASTFAIAFSDVSDGGGGGTVNFTLSASGNAGAFGGHYPNSGDGLLSMGDVGTGAVTLTGTDGGGNGNFLNPSLQNNAIGGSFQVVFVATAGPNVTQTFTAAQDGFTASATGTFSAIRFVNTSAVGDVLTMDNLTTTMVCYLEGTMIATPEGTKAVEDLRAGDVVLTTEGTTTVHWLGEQPVETATANPARVNPIRIRAGALADGVPARDLLVSPDHAVGIDGYLVNASALVNGTTVTREARMPAQFTYYHVETGAHELLLAEGCPAESYVDFITRDAFVNGAERAGAPVIPEMAVPRISAARHLPEAIRETLAARAEALAVTRAA